MGKRLPFDKADNWDERAEYRIPGLRWRKKFVGGGYVTRVDGKKWMARLNDFPDEPAFTLIVNGEEILHFNGWPPEWSRK